MRLSIRWRLTLWNMLALAASLLILGALVYGLLSHILYKQLDRTLETELGELKDDPELLKKPAKRFRYWLKEMKEHENINCIVYDAEGRVRDHTPGFPDGEAPPMPATLPEQYRVEEMIFPTIGRQRMLSSRLQTKKEEFTLLFMTSLEELNQTRLRLMTVLLMVVPFALGLAGVLGYFLARKALAPIEQMHRLTEEINADQLDRRLPTANSGDELDRLAYTINGMIGRLERSFAEIRRFTADASHELRTPLTAIRTEAEVALREPLSPAEYQQTLSSVLEECGRLTQLADHLLTLTREEAGIFREAHATIDLEALVGGAVETMLVLIEAKGLELQWHSGGALFVKGNDVRLRQVIYNILDNAVKYTPSGGRIAVQLRQDGATVAVLVSDTGIGIPPEHLPRVFDRFYRVDQGRGREQGGAGLGLSIAQMIVNAHGGCIELTSSPGQGTTCAIRLPIVTDASAKSLGEMVGVLASGRR